MHGEYIHGMRTERTYMEDMHMNNICIREHAYGIHNSVKISVQTEGKYTKYVQREYVHTGDIQIEG